jgi:phosphatidylserine/phosphatidylglycerophosphate/cardiolipin synthase-like enzyme
VAAILATLSPLADLILQADGPVRLAEMVLADIQSGTTDGQPLVVRISAAVHDDGLVLPCLALAGIVDSATRVVCPGAVVPAAQILAVVETYINSDHWQLALTVPAFVRSAFTSMVADLPPTLCPIETVPAMHVVAASACERLVLAAPYLHQGFVSTFIPHVNRIMHAGGTVVVLTRALSALSAQQSHANVEALQTLRAGASNHELLLVRSWEEDGLGVHLKAVVADERMAYIGSANLTPTGTSTHAEAGVLLSGPSVMVLARWLEVVSDALSERR